MMKRTIADLRTSRLLHRAKRNQKPNQKPNQK